MAIRVALNHYTRYRYDRPITLSPHLVRLRPAPHCRAPVQGYSLRITPTDHFINWQQDPFGNWVARIVFPERVREFAIEVDVVAEMVTINPFDFFLDEEAQRFPYAYPAELAHDLAPYLALDESGPLLAAWLAEVSRGEQDMVSFLVALNQRLQHDVAYSVRMEPGVQSCEQTLERAIGSCRDSAWLLAQILRHLGLASRFVSGYLVQLKADEKSLDGPSGPEADFTDLHAWTEVYLPGGGWIGLDPTSGLFAGEGHIPLACTPEPASAAPVSGAAEPAEVEFYFHNRVTRVHEDPRVTRPYSDDQWQAVMALGARVDEELEDGDVRLTLGGEPTFVSIDDMDGPEWSTEALGEAKRRLADDLVRRLWHRFAPGGVLHTGQGKWYPGEPLPRWALSVLWRPDGEPLWHDTRWLSDGKDLGHGAADAGRLVQALAMRLGLAADYVIPAHEDAWYYVWHEANLPANVDPHELDLKAPGERRKLAELFDRGLAEVAGYVLPVRHGEERGWMSSRWPLRRERLYLAPGDSPMGFRLPLGSLPWVDPDQREQQHETDPFEKRVPLIDDHRRRVAARVAERKTANTGSGKSAGQTSAKQAAAKKAAEIFHTAICVQAREGVVHVFFPPFTDVEHWLELLAAVEGAVIECELPVVLEGYLPPRDPRLKLLQVTPDPGVIEVNIHPAASWDELVDNTTALYEEARQARLATEKFMLDGRHTGTGGGNHVTLGGLTPADSPLLRRPGLLRSLLTYWQHHPSLSYLFSGAFIGPTSQAPRVDEARDDNLYELEIAFQQIPSGDTAAPWLVDRVLRNLLIDLTGNTHRAEFCIDKLYSPDGPAGRLGLLEFRGFEMPPHARMSLVQVLLLRTLVARFWSNAYHRRPIRWGTELHDRFMLPHFVWQEVLEVSEDLARAGYEFDAQWFAPFHEFRFPVYGRIAARGVELELRWAVEPWHVLGEEMGAGGTARYVDSSVERLQVKVSGLIEERYAIACNGRRVPLRPTGTRGEYVAGVRYKAWQPHSGLHPTIPVHAPLTFDIVDLGAGRSVAGCTYHVSHPAGRNYETFPVNANEAEARRIARFWPHGHTPGPIQLAPEQPHPDHPFTLDLRRLG